MHSDRNPNPFSRLFLVCLLLGFVAVLSGCGTGGKPPTYDAGDSGSTIHVKMGEPIMVRLLTNITVGGRWEIVELDRAIVDLNGEPRTMGSVVVGALARISSTEYDFRGMKEGSTKLVMRLNRPDTGELVDSFEMTIVVSGGSPVKLRKGPPPGAPIPPPGR
jgi:predicted secreted protein